MPIAPEPFGREAFDRLAAEKRALLHRYCARMTGSVIDGEDVAQEALVKAIEALPDAGEIANPEAWLFRIAHNAALDFLRRRARRETPRTHEELDMVARPLDPAREREIAAQSLRTFMRLPVAQRGAVILKDVLGHSIEEIGAIMGGRLPAAKSALQRGRARLRELAREPEDVSVPALAADEIARLRDYVDRFNARDFDAVRQMLADDVRLELVNRLALQGRTQVSPYFHRYGEVDEWRFVAGIVDGRPAMLAFDKHDPQGTPVFFVLFQWRADGVVGIRDFLFARYAVEGAEIFALD